MKLLKLSKGWVWTRLENCVEILDNQRIPINADERGKRISGKSTSELYSYYGATGQVGWIDDYIFDEELVLLGEDGAPFFESTKNKAYIIKGKSWVNNHAHVVRAIAGVTLNPFICHYLNTFDYNGYVTGTTRPKLNQSPMRRIPLPLPPLPEQHRIVEKIEELFTELDAGVEALKKVKAQLKRYRQAVLKHTFEGKLTEEWREKHKNEIEPANVLLERIRKEMSLRGAERRSKLKDKDEIASPSARNDSLPGLPEGWVWTSVGQLYDIVGGGTPSTSVAKYWNGDIHWITSADIYGLKDIRPRKKITKEAIENSATNLVPKGSIIVVTRVGLGKVALTKTPICFSQDSQALVGNKSVIPDYSLYYLSKAVQIFKYEHRGTTIAGVTKKQLAELQFPLSPLPEQHKIVEEIERRFSVADEVEKTVGACLQQAQRLRQSILKRAFEGKLVSQDPTDEPAEKLLERIKAEKAKQQEKKRLPPVRYKVKTTRGRG